jgi:hypothetical protein
VILPALHINNSLTGVAQADLSVMIPVRLSQLFAACWTRLRESSKGHADVKRWKMSPCVELRAHRTGQILPDHAPTKQTAPTATFNRSSPM